MEGEPLTLAGLNDLVRGWLAAIDAKKLSGFDESRAERFKREAPLLQGLPGSVFDVRHDIPVLVSRESLICHASNSYSVPPEHIGAMITLKVHPFDREAELMGPAGSIRRFQLSPEGSKSRLFFPEDRQALHQRWDEDRARLARIRKPKVAKTKARNPQVEVCPPSLYDELFPVEPMAATV
jgi:hypothetical protein